jgi:beta-mannosidase
MEVAETFATREQILSRAPEFEWHQKNSGGNRRIRETMLRYFKPPKDVAAELLLSQFQQGMAIKMGVEGWRAQRPRCMGTLYWQLNDNWPVASWSSIEYGNKWKPLHHMARRFYAPIAVVAQPEIQDGKADVTRGAVYALNDTAATVKGELLVEYWTYDGRIVSSRKSAVSLAPDSSTRLVPFLKPQDRPEPLFLHLTLTTPHGVSRNDWHFGYYKDMPLAAAKVSVKSEGRRVIVASDKPAFFVWANVRGVRGEFDDNAFTLLPGRPRTLTFNGELDCSRLTVSDLSGLVK